MKNYRNYGEYEPTETLSDLIENYFDENGIDAKLDYAEYDDEYNRTEIGWKENGEHCSTVLRNTRHSSLEQLFELWKIDRDEQLDYIYSI